MFAKQFSIFYHEKKQNPHNKLKTLHSIEKQKIMLFKKHPSEKK